VILFFLLLFTHPGFYLHYTYDVYSVSAFFFALLALLAYFLPRYQFPLVSLFTLLSGLCKETYLPSIIIFALAQFYLQPRITTKTHLQRTIVLIIITILVILRAKFIGSPFNALTPDPNAPYYTNFHPFSLIKTYFYYGKSLFSPPLLLLILLVGWDTYRRRQLTTFAHICILTLMGLAAYLPYSLLPNHTLPYYVFVAVPFCYSFLLLWPSMRKISYLHGVILIIIFAHFLYLRHKSYPMWQNYLHDEKITHNFLLALPVLKAYSFPQQKILILGLENYTLSPLQSRTFFARFFVDYPVQIDYTQRSLWHRSTYTHEITPDQAAAQLENYDIIYTFNQDGYLINISHNTS
jgi:hypothetical protein